MIVGINARNEIKQIGKVTDSTLQEVEISDSTLDSMSEFMLLNHIYKPYDENSYGLDPVMDYETLVRMDAMNTENVALKEITKQQDILLLESDLRLMDVEFAIEGLLDSPIALANTKQMSARGSSYDLLLRMIVEGNYTNKEVMESNIQKYYDRNRITEEEYLYLLEVLNSETTPSILSE